MFKAILVVCGAVAFGLTGVVQAAEHGHAHKKELKPQTTCPIMGGKINKNLYYDHDGKRIYVCCGGCIAAIKKDPAAAIEKLKAKGEKPDEIPIAQKTCPVMGGKINPALYVEHEGKKIYVCCKGCIETVKKDFAKYAKKVAEQISADEKKDAEGKMKHGASKKSGAKAHSHHGCCP